VPLDLASPASVREAAARIVAAHPRVDILVNNAGVMAILERRTVEGLEMQLGVNHLGHFALTALLLPALLESDDARVVSVTSTGRHSGRPIDPENPHLEGRYEPWRAYGQSKLAKRALCARARAAVPGGGRAGKEHRGAPGVREHRLAGAERARDRRRPQPTLLPERRRAVRHVAGVRCARAAPGGDGSEHRRRCALHAEVGELGSPVRRPLLGRSRSRKAMTTLWEVSERETGIAFDVPRHRIT
jgi:NAD(P)-dependent dehydrogenase (short-subunit alcohol dehydrogenase family)